VSQSVSESVSELSDCNKGLNGDGAVCAWEMNIEEYICVTAMHNTVLHYTALHCTTLQYTALQYTALYYTALYYTALHCNALQYTALYCYVPLAMQSTAEYRT
jgi:hypothetical protein